MEMKFPAGLRVLAVDGDINALHLIQELGSQCHFNVTTCSKASDALSLLREKNYVHFELMLIGVRMRDMDGFEFLQQLTNEINVPAISMMYKPEEYTTTADVRAITMGASDFFIKPLTVEQFSTIWRPVMKRAFKEENITTLEEYDRKKRGSNSSLTDEVEGVAADAAMKEITSTKAVAVVDEPEINGYAPAPKKRRIVWTTELHECFVRAVTQLGLTAVPKKILEVMNDPALTRENVASHLQKYRKYWKSNAEAQHQQIRPRTRRQTRMQIHSMPQLFPVDNSMLYVPSTSSHHSQIVPYDAPAACTDMIESNLLNQDPNYLMMPLAVLPPVSSEYSTPLEVLPAASEYSIPPGYSSFS